MRRDESGISLLEVVIALAIVMLVLYVAMMFFIGTVRQYKVQTKIVETNVEGILGLEMMRRDMESMGYGLHWDDGPAYGEPAGPATTIVNLNGSPAAPRPVVSIKGPPSTVTVNGSDYLVIRSASVGRSDAAGKWTTLRNGPVTRNWGSPEDLSSTDRVIVIAPGGVNQSRRVLVTLSGTTFGAVGGSAPADPNQVFVVYGIDNGDLARPFNRADYYIDNAAVTVPPRCASNTGVLVKAVLRHDGNSPDVLPLLDCVADMQVVYGLDNNADRVVDVWTDDISNAGLFPAATIRAQLAEIKVYLLAQQGQRDDSYRHLSTPILVGPDNVVGRNVDVSGYPNYRWKVYSIVVKPRNLAN